MTGCIISNNYTIYNNSYAGGLNCIESTMTIKNCEIKNNTAAYGGGISFKNNANQSSIIGCLIENNRASDEGGGVYCYNSSPIISECIISNNSASGSTGGGGFCCLENSSPILTDCEFMQNTSTNYGGGISKPDKSLFFVLAGLIDFQ